MNDLKTVIGALGARMSRLPAIPMDPTMTATRVLKIGLAIVPGFGGLLG